MPDGFRTLAFALLGCAIATSSGAVPPRTGHPLIGVWRLASPGLDCHETVEFRPDGTSHSSSARGEASGAYEVSERAEASGRYVLSASLIRSNGRPDCFGDTPPVGVAVTSYVQIYPGDRLFFCSGPTSTDCFGPYVAVTRRAARPGT